MEDDADVEVIRHLSALASDVAEVGRKIKRADEMVRTIIARRHGLELKTACVSCFTAPRRDGSNFCDRCLGRAEP